MNRHRLVSIVTAVVGRAREAQLSFLAASLAYYMLVSLFPLGLLAFVVASAIGGEAFARAVIDTVSAFLSPSGTELLDEALHAGAGRGGATVVGILLLLWSGLRVFRGLDVAFSLVYGRDELESLTGQIRDGTVALGGIGVAIGSLIVVNAALSITGVGLTNVGGTVLVAATLFVAFYPFYYLFPDVELDLRDALPGAVFAAVGWTLLGATFTLYAANAGSFALYGAIGAVLLLVTWFYIAGAILLMGAVINAVVADADVDPPVEPARGLTEADARDRQRQKAAPRSVSPMSDEDAPARGEDGRDAAETGHVAGTSDAAGDRKTVADEAELERLREELAQLREEVDEKSLPRDELESDLRRYVRARVRRGKATGWGPYLVLLYGTAMTIGAFYYLGDLAAILAMFVIWLSTLGLYTLMWLVGATTSAVGLPGKAIDRIRDFRR